MYKEVLMVSTDELNFFDEIFWPNYVNVSRILPSEIYSDISSFKSLYYSGYSGSDYNLKYQTIAQALADGWELLSAPVQTGTPPNHLYYSWVLVKR